MAKRGRPIGSSVRQRMVDILHIYECLHGYAMHNIYTEIFGDVNLRLIYYHFNKGLETREFETHSREIQKGEYSWGSQVERKKYVLGPEATPRTNDAILEHYQDHSE